MLIKRIGAFYIDCFIIVAPCMLLSIPLFFFGESDNALSKIYYVLYLLSIAFCYVGLIGKDIIGKRSVGKRIFKLKVVSKNESSPTYFQLIIRNFFMLIWPIEALLLALDKERLGDKVSNTKVIFEHEV